MFALSVEKLDLTVGKGIVHLEKWDNPFCEDPPE